MSERAYLASKQPAASALHLTPATFGILQRKCACSGSGGECEECGKKKMTLQRHPAGRNDPAAVPPIVHDVLRSSGRPLDAETRAFFEPRFGHDFSRVRVHTDEKATKSASQVNALAYASGRNVVFAAGLYSPSTTSGRRLLAHELAHVVQQRNCPGSSPHLLSSPGDSLEQEAARAGAASMEAGPSTHLSGSPPLLQRQDAGVPASPDAGPPVSVPPAAPPATTTASAPATSGSATPVAPLKATRIAFKTSGALDPQNCSAIKPAGLGVGAAGSASNGMEMTYRIDGTIPAGTQFDILRTRTDTFWQQVGGAWAQIFHDPAGTNDDHTNDDECLAPTATKHIFVIDQPGLKPGRDPRGVGVFGGATVSASATAFAAKFSFAEWVIAKSPGGGWEVISDPTFTFWHSITSVAQIAGGWTLVDTPRGQHNEISLGSIVTTGATP